MRKRRSPRGPQLEALEDRIPPGNTLGGLIGFSLSWAWSPALGPDLPASEVVHAGGPPEASTVAVTGTAPVEALAGSTTVEAGPSVMPSDPAADPEPAGGGHAQPTAIAIPRVATEAPTAPGSLAVIALGLAAPEGDDDQAGGPAVVPRDGLSLPQAKAAASAGVAAPGGSSGGASGAPAASGPVIPAAAAPAASDDAPSAPDLANFITLVMASNALITEEDAAALAVDVLTTTTTPDARGFGPAQVSDSTTGLTSTGTRTNLLEAPDPAVPGSYQVTREEYNFGNTALSFPGFPTATVTAPLEFAGSITRPTDLSDGPFPLVVFMHGRHATVYNPATGGGAALGWPPTATQATIPSYQGYDYISDSLASQGYIVASISVNGINAQDNNNFGLGMLARAQMMQTHLDLYNTLNTTGSAPFGDTFVGKIDMQNVGLMGHSRGGEGVATSYVYNRSLGSPYGIKAVFALAPTDFNRFVTTDVALAVLLPYTDGDVSDLQGVHFYDDALYASPGDPTPKHSILVMGANHNFFNTIWTPGLFVAGTSDDWGFVPSGGVDPYAGNRPGNQRLTPAQQRGVGVAYMSAFFRTYLGGDNEFLPILTEEAAPPPSAEGAAVYVAYQPPDNPASRLDLNRLTSQSNLNTNTLGGAVSQAGLTTYIIVGGANPVQQFLLPNQPRAREPHTTVSARAATVPGLSQLSVTWQDTSAFYENDLPAGARNVSTYAALTFRTGINFGDFRSTFDTQDFSVVLTDGAGQASSTTVSPWTNWLFYPPGKVNPLPKVLLDTVRIPLAAFTGINLTDVQSVQFKFDQRTQGALVFADLAFAGPTTTTTAPTNPEEGLA